jgi:undecaprenyl-diphosphatase
MSSFIEMLHSIDNNILLFINGKNSPFLDQVMFLISGRFTWIPLYLLLAILIWKKYKKDSWVIILFAVLAIVLSDQFSNLVKNEVMRLRPSHTPGLTNLLHYYKNSRGELYMGGSYGFVSNHAANSTSLTLYITLLFRNKLLTGGLILWMCLLCYSRMYLGVHFPSDILGGMIVGLLAGFIAYRGCLLLQKQLAMQRN